MKRIKPSTLASLLALLSGAAGLTMRIWLFRSGIDERGLFLSSHPAMYLLPGLAVVFLAAALPFSLKVVPDSYQKRFPRSVAAALGNWAAAAGLLIFSILALRSTPDITAPVLLSGILGILSAVCLVFLGFCRWKPTRPSPLFQGIVTVYCMVFLLTRYAVWSAEPQLAVCCFEALAGISLLLTSYYRTTLDARQKCWRMYTFFIYTAFFFCFLSLIGEDKLFFLSMLLWTAANLPLLRPRKKASQQNQEAMVLPRSARVCIQTLERAGFEAYAVGGCVRDSLLGLTPHDYDLCTSATPEEICTVFSDRKLVRSGEKHGTIGVVMEDGLYEITTFRAEGAYTDNRHPDWVAFVTHLEDDLKRRDFTVNAMAYSPAKGYIDPYGGREDLKNRILRTVGEPEDRFQEDALRILRGVRFAVRYQLTPEENTAKAMEALAPLMDNLARERVLEELSKLLPLANAEDLVRYAPVITQVIPELAPCIGFEQHSIHHNYDIYTHTAQVVAAVPADLPLRWAALLHDIGKPDVFTLDEEGQGHFRGHAQAGAQKADAILRRLKAPTELREQVVLLVDQHMTPQEPDRKLLLRRLGKYGEETLRRLLSLQRADFGGKGTEDETDIFTQTEMLLDQLLAEKACLTAQDLAITGRDILEMGIEPGPLVGQCMRFLLEKVQDQEIPNTREALIEAAANFLAPEPTDPAETIFEEGIL